MPILTDQFLQLTLQIENNDVSTARDSDHKNLIRPAFTEDNWSITLLLSALLLVSMCHF